MPAQNKAPAAPPKPPRAILIMDAPTNGLIASYLIEKGYSVEIIRDMKYCSTNLLKSAKFIFLGPNEEESAFYDKIKATLKKMVPDRLFEESGQELIAAVKTKVTSVVQPLKGHPHDSKLEAEKRKIEDEAALAKLPADKPTGPVKDDNSLEGLLNSVTLRPFSNSSISNLAAQLDKGDETQQTGLPVNEKLAGELKKYTNILGAIGKVNAEREILSEEEIPEDALTALSNMGNQLTKPSSPEKILQKAKMNEEKAQQAKEAGKPFPPRKLPEGELYDEVIYLQQLQDDLITAKAKMRYDMADFFANNICKDKHYKIFKAVGVKSNYMYGTLYFYLALITFKDQCKTEFKNLYKQYKKEMEGFGPPKKKGFFSKKTEEEPTEIPPEVQKLEADVMTLACSTTQLEKDLATFEAELCNGFWDIYEQLCHVTLIEKVKNKSFLRYIRSFLRFGLVSEHKSMINEDQKNAIFSACKSSKDTFLHEDGDTNIAFPDEALLQMSKGHIPYSFDEELELNGQGTPAYKYDKVVRKMYASDFKVKVFTREINKWQSKIDKQKEAVASAEQMLEEHEKGTKEYKTVQTSMREAKAEMARVSKIVEKLQETIDTETETIQEQQQAKDAIDFTPDLKEKASIEAKTIRRFCKFMANLKENFFPFQLRDNYKPESNNLFNQKVTGDAVKAFEENDPMIYTTDLVNAQNPRKAVYVRYSPLYMVLPCMGINGSCVAPSNASDTGRFVMPLMGAQQTPLDKIIIDMSADFRYDTAKENAGMDLMTSDTICAAYAKVRWDYRKKSKEFREKAGIYNDMQDKKNFKVHYRLYMESMDESGKKLFFKCHEMYEGFVKYIPLPKGKEKLSRN